MKRRMFGWGMLAALLTFGLALAGCDNPTGGTDSSYKPTYELEGGGTLTITGGEGEIAPKTDDTFELVIGGKKTTGKIEVDANGTITFIPQNGGDPFTANPGSEGAITIDGGSIRADDGATVEVPSGEVTPSAPGGGELEKMPGTIQGVWKKDNITLTIREASLIISGAAWSGINDTFAITLMRGYEDHIFIAFGPLDDPFYVGLRLKREGANLIIPSDSGPDELHGTWTAVSSASGGGELEKMPGTIQGVWEKDNITLTIREASLIISGAAWSEINDTFAITLMRGYEDHIFIAFGPSDDPFYVGLRLKREGANLIIPSDSGPDELHGTWTAVSSAP